MKFYTYYLINFICHQLTNKFVIQNNKTDNLNLHCRIVKIVSNGMEHELKNIFEILKSISSFNFTVNSCWWQGRNQITGPHFFDRLWAQTIVWPAQRGLDKGEMWPRSKSSPPFKGAIVLPPHVGDGPGWDNISTMIVIAMILVSRRPSYTSFKRS